MRKSTTNRASLYSRRQRRRAEKIIQATGRYSSAFRTEVQQALDNCPHKLPVLFREADRIDERLKIAGERLDAAMRRQGIPKGRSPRPVSRSPKRCTVRLAEEVEALFTQDNEGLLDESMSQRAQLISNILFDIGNESQINATHSKLVKAYVLAIQEVLPSLDDHSHRTVDVALRHVSEMIDGCSQSRFGHLENYWSVDWNVAKAAREKEHGQGKRKPETEPERVAAQSAAPEVAESDELVTLREKLATLELLPENEAISFKLESEIYRLEQSAPDEWAEVIM